MANVLFSRTSDPSSKPITDGQLIFDTSGNGKMYLDNGTERLEMGGSMSVDSVLNAESTNPIQNKAVAGVMLKTLDEVGAVTKAGFIPDALTVKQLNSNLADGQISFSVVNGEPYVKVGADSPRPFSSGETLLWENPDSSLVFDANNIDLDMSQYSKAIIKFYDWRYGNEISQVINKGSRSKISSYDGTYGYYRFLTISDTKIAFENGYRNNAITGYSCIPLSVYGLK